MDKEVVKFFENAGCLMTYLLDPRKQPTILLDAQVKAGAESYYQKIKSGEIKARPPQYAAGVWEEAKIANYTHFLRDNEILEHHKKIAEAMIMAMMRLQRKKWMWMSVGFLICFGGFYLVGVLQRLGWL